MFDHYRRLFATPGTAAFVLAGLIGRFPISMLGLGSIVLVTGEHGSYGLAGGVTAVLALAEAVAAPVVGRVSDRLGQRPVLIVSATVHGVGLSWLVAVGVTGAPVWLYFPAAAIAGGGVPQISSLVRARWASRLAGTPTLSTALALESVLDEVVFVVGPVLATILGTLVWPAAGLVVAGGSAVTGALVLASRRDSEPARATDSGGRRPSAIRTAGLRVLVPSFVMFGVVFGALDVAVVGFAQDHGHKALSGVLLAELAVGSLLSGVFYGARHWSASLRRRFLLAAAALTVVSAAVAASPTLPVMAIVIFFAGFAVSPTVVAGMGLVEALVPPAARTEGFAWAITAVTAGAALGSIAAGVVVSEASGQRALLVCVAGAAATFLVGLAGVRRLVVGGRHEAATVRAVTLAADGATR